MRNILKSSQTCVGNFPCFSDSREHASKNFQTQALVIFQPMRPALDDTYPVSQTFHEAERHFVLRFAEGGNAVPMTSDHIGKFLVGLQPLPLERGAPIFEKAAGMRDQSVTPQLPEGFL